VQEQGTNHLGRVDDHRTVSCVAFVGISNLPPVSGFLDYFRLSEKSGDECVCDLRNICSFVDGWLG